MGLKKKISKKIKKLSTKTYFTKTIYAKLKELKRSISYTTMYKKTSVDENLIIFESFFAKKYACSPKAIYEYMLNSEEYKDYKFVWAFRNPKAFEELKKNDRTELVKYDTKKYYRYYAKAKYWVTNARIPDCIKKKDNQIYLQCWHGTPLKKLGYDIKVSGNNVLSSNKEVRRQYNHDASRYSYMISPSKFCTEKFTSAFNLEALGKKDIMIEKGYPRNDFLYTFKDEDVERIKEELGLPKDKKIIMYAPTWRDNNHQLGKGYVLDLQLDLDKLREKFSKDYIVLLRLHYLLANNLDLSGYEGFAFDVSKYSDVNDLYIITDILITDYSSVFFDYANLRRPIIFYMYDLEEYKNDTRDFYIDLADLPGDIAQKEEDLIADIENIEEYKEKYKEKYKKFNETYNYLDDGKATERVVKEVFKK